jgi:flagellar hook-length control protein FliK
VPQVASDPKIHAPSHSLPRIGRPAQQPDRAPSPFESLLDDSTQTNEQSALPVPENKAGPADRSQAPAKNNESKPATADDDVTKSDPVETTVNFDGDGKPAGENKTAVNAKAAAATGEAIKTVDKDDKPAEAPKTDNPTVTPSTDSTQTVITTSAVALAPATGPAANPTPKPDANAGEQPAELPQLSAMAADGMPKLKGLDGPKAGTGKQAGTEKKADTETPADADVSPVETTTDLQPADKGAPQSHAGKPQFASSESDKDRVAQARGEASSVDHRSADTPESLLADPSGKSPSISADTTAPTMVTEPAQTTPAAAAPATAVTQAAAQQAAPIPLAGLAVEIAGRAIAGKNRFEIRLDPPELGRIEVRLDVDRDGNVTSRLIVDRADTFDLLRRDAAGLERALQDAGLKTADNGLQFSLRDQSMNQQQTNGGSDVAQIVVQDETRPSADVIPQNYGRLAGQGGGLDIRV